MFTEVSTKQKEKEGTVFATLSILFDATIKSDGSALSKALDALTLQDLNDYSDSFFQNPDKNKLEKLPADIALLSNEQKVIWNEFKKKADTVINSIISGNLEIMFNNPITTPAILTVQNIKDHRNDFFKEK